MIAFFLVLAIDFGGTQVKSALVSEDLVLEKSLPTQSSPQTLDKALDVIDHLVTSVEIALSGSAISVPETVDMEGGCDLSRRIVEILSWFSCQINPAS